MTKKAPNNRALLSKKSFNNLIEGLKALITLRALEQSQLSLRKDVWIRMMMGVLALVDLYKRNLFKGKNHIKDLDVIERIKIQFIECIGPSSLMY